MIKKLIQIGSNSTGIILDKAILELLRLNLGSEVEIDIDSKARTLTLRPASESEDERREAFKKAQAKVMSRHKEAFRRLAKR